MDADINKYIAEEIQDQGNLADLPEWSEGRARELAADESIGLSDAHWEVVFFLRERFRERGQPRSAREIVGELEQKYGDKGGRRYLYGLFPGGPVTQGSRIAGLPLPPYATDPSFGSSE